MTNTTAMQGLLLGALRVWSVTPELGEAVAADLAERGGAAPAVTLTDALDTLVKAACSTA